MDNQHRKIKGYRELSQEDIDLMNAVKTKGSELLELQRRIANRLNGHASVVREHMERVDSDPTMDRAEAEVAKVEYLRLRDAEPQRWAAIAKTDIQTGIMALVRAIAQPTEC